MFQNSVTKVVVVLKLTFHFAATFSMTLISARARNILRLGFIFRVYISTYSADFYRDAVDFSGESNEAMIAIRSFGGDCTQTDTKFLISGF